MDISALTLVVPPVYTSSLLAICCKALSLLFHSVINLIRVLVLIVLILDLSTLRHHILNRHCHHQSHLSPIHS